MGEHVVVQYVLAKCGREYSCWVKCAALCRAGEVWWALESVFLECCDRRFELRGWYARRGYASAASRRRWGRGNVSCDLVDFVEFRERRWRGLITVQAYFPLGCFWISFALWREELVSGSPFYFLLAGDWARDKAEHRKGCTISDTFLAILPRMYSTSK